MMLNSTAKLLIIDDNEDVLLAAKLLLKPYVSEVKTETKPEKLPEILSSNSYDVILLDMNFTRDVSGGEEGLFWLKEIIKIDPTAIVIMITAYGDIDLAVKAIKSGATDFIQKPWQNERLLATISTSLKLLESKRETASLTQKNKALSENGDRLFSEFLGKSPAMEKIFSTIEKVAPTDANILIQGENGTGKELVARAIHRASVRKNDIFLAVDLGSLSETLFESELFGHKKGAFTDAKEERIGRFLAASGGTLFLDEIGNTPLHLQAKLLSALQSQSVTPLGSNLSKPINVRLITATNANLHQLSREKSFREDLLYRINTIEIHLPPLRERGLDIALLATHFLNQFATKYKKGDMTFTPETISLFQKARWRGNVRELRHAVERAVILAESSLLTPEDFPNTEINPIEITGSIHQEKHTVNLESVEKEAIQKALEQCNGNITEAAKILGLTRGSLYRRLEKYGL
ncbi:MAG: sigma-54 dependent transcriptional regulator [Chloroherpetonaceae bacterium]|nr:sigma-54 dependent transcriptional regulator [Chloroherpetonaceae bacterium]